MERLRGIKESLLMLLYPDHAVCMGCGDLAGTEEGWLCEECMEQLETLSMQDRHLCDRCGSPVKQGRRCRDCADWPDDGVQIARYCYGYDHPVDEAVRQMKYTGVYRMTEWMGGKVAELLDQGAYGRTDLLVPVPMHPARMRERGRNHALCIAQEVSRVTGVPVWTGLRRIRNTKQQARLKGDVRKSAMAGAFSVDPKDVHELIGKRIVLIDDVITTGATVNSCARALYANGAACVCAAAFAGHLSAAENTDVQSGSKDYTK